MTPQNAIDNSLARLEATIAAKPPEVQAEQERRYEALQRMTGHRPPLRGRCGDRAEPLLLALNAIDRDAEAQGLDPYYRREAVASVIAEHLALAYGKPVTEAGRSGVWKCLRDNGEPVVRHVAVDLIREHARNVKEPFGVLVYRARLHREDLEASRARKGPRR